MAFRLGAEAVDQMRQLWQADMRKMRNVRGNRRVYYRSPNTAVLCNTVRFEVLSVDEDTRSVLGSVEAVSSGCTINDLPDKTISEGTAIVDICDPLGCYFNEPSADMLGRRGWARYMLPLLASTCQPESYDIGPQWEVFALCCDITECTT